MTEMKPFAKNKIKHRTNTCLFYEKNRKYFNNVFKASYEAKLICEPMCVLVDLLYNQLYIYCNLKFYTFTHAKVKCYVNISDM